MAVSIDEARNAVLEHVKVLGSEEVVLDDALGRALAADASAPNDVPPFAASAMDGFAIRAADTIDGSAQLQVIGESKAGAAAGVAVRRGTAVRISTGAPIPEGADAVVPQELTTRENSTVVIDGQIALGYHIRCAGEDIRAGELVVSAGCLLGPAELGVLASMNIPRPRVVRRPRVAIAGTGDELTDPGKPLKPGSIRDSNGPALGGAVHRAGAELVTRMRVGDDLEATVAVLGAGLRDVDMLITTGGVSVGPHDHVRPALKRLGFREVFAGVKMKPGRPTTFAVGEDGTLVFALPGNPVSALMGFRLFVVPALDAMLGRETVIHPVNAVADEELPGAIGRTTIVRCRTTLHDDGWHVRPTKSQDSHILTSMLGVDALALVPADRTQIAPGEPVEIEFVVS
ncbi:MAG: molybdopterin molybdotransferase [Solirubrobacteraceae bacterium]|nr:molybdopterin molybdotransferase [Solirubrobacteraceae bacterium]MEA2183028.1 molybdopterin molybdotransferase [Solirubrobacteraceae bacterium]MEA2185678.1 molybdopterin molybdotransferase [Solirubrobacteraceae bacterium]